MHIHVGEHQSTGRSTWIHTTTGHVYIVFIFFLFVITSFMHFVTHNSSLLVCANQFLSFLCTGFFAYNHKDHAHSSCLHITVPVLHSQLCNPKTHKTQLEHKRDANRLLSWILCILLPVFRKQRATQTSVLCVTYFSHDIRYSDSISVIWKGSIGCKGLPS